MRRSLNSSTPYSWVKRTGIPVIVAVTIGYLYGIGAFAASSAATTTTPVCTTPASTTAPRR